MIDPFELLWDEATVKQEVADFFDEFDETAWNLNGGGIKERFGAVLAEDGDLIEHYRHEAGYVYQSGWNQTNNDERGKYLAMRRVALENGCQSALDYGCGIGTGPIVLALAGLEKVVGADINKPCLDFLTRRKVRLGLDNLIVKDLYGSSTRYKVDLMICTEVYEHVEDPVGLAHTLDKLLKPGGVAVYSWSFVDMPGHLPQHFDRGWQASHPDTFGTEGFGKEVLTDQLGYVFKGFTWFNNHLWHKPDEQPA